MCFKGHCEIHPLRQQMVQGEWRARHTNLLPDKVIQTLTRVMNVSLRLSETPYPNRVVELRSSTAKTLSMMMKIYRLAN